MGTRSALASLGIAALLAFGLDQWSKAVVTSHIGVGASIPAVPGLLWWTYIRNPFGAFGLFGSSPMLLAALSVAVLALIAYPFRDALQRSTLTRIAFGLIAGGTLGNVVDRFEHAWVVDFIDFRTIWSHVFNVADTCITIGVALIVLASFRRVRNT